MDESIRLHLKRMDQWYAERRASWKPGWREATAERSLPREEQTRGAIPAETRAEVFARYGRKCGVCGDFGNTLDHVIPTSRGGDHHPSNLQVLCKPCNSAKTNMTMEEWLASGRHVRVPREKSDRGPNPTRYCWKCDQLRRGARVDHTVCCVCREALPLQTPDTPEGTEQ